jgi:hypothetical protein
MDFTYKYSIVYLGWESKKSPHVLLGNITMLPSRNNHFEICPVCVVLCSKHVLSRTTLLYLAYLVHFCGWWVINHILLPIAVSPNRRKQWQKFFWRSHVGNLSLQMHKDTQNCNHRLWNIWKIQYQNCTQHWSTIKWVLYN